MSNGVMGVLLDPGVDDVTIADAAQSAKPPENAESSDSLQSPIADPDPAPKETATQTQPPATPTPDSVADLDKIRKDFEAQLQEQKRLTEFWASKAGAATPTAPAPAPPPPKQYTKEEIADAISNGDVEVLRDLGYVRRDDVEDIAAKAAQEQLRQQTTANQFEQRIATTYADYINPANEKFKLLQAEIESNPIYRTIGKVDQHAALEMALTVVHTREQAKAAQPPPVDYDARINRQAPPTTKPKTTQSVSTVATPMQMRTAEAMGIPVDELLKELREMKGMA